MSRSLVGPPGGPDRRSRRNRSAALLFLGALLISALSGGALPPQEPGTRRVDLLVLDTVERMETARAAGEALSPTLARRSGLVVDPAGTSEPWIKVLVSGPGAETAVRLHGGTVGGRIGDVVTARLPLDRVLALSESPGVRFVEGSYPARPALDASLPAIHADDVHTTYGYKGAGILVAVYDSGIDFLHRDFRKADGTTRIKELWDQTAGSAGTKWTKTQIDAAISVGGLGITQQDVTGHGTHVTGIAAGNGRATGNSQPSGRFVGVAPEADLLIIKGGDDTYSSVDIIDGIVYAAERANAWGQPVVVNLSLGGHLGPHDGTSNYEEAIDSFSGTGRAVVVSAGNEGDDRIHSRRSLSAAAPTATVSFVVPTYTPEDDSENDYTNFDIWYDGTARLRLSVTSPNGRTYGPWDTPASGINYPSVQNTADGAVDPILGGTPDERNSDREIQLELKDQNADDTPEPGTWTIHLELLEGFTATVDLWIWDDTIGTDISGGTPDYSVSMPATSFDAITVGAFVTKWSWTGQDASGDAITVGYSSTNRTGNYALFSSWGPTRDGRLKPELSAPGQGITSSASSAIMDQFTTEPASYMLDPDDVHYTSQGTSQAAPHVTGAVALLLEADPTLHTDQIRGNLMLSAQPYPFAPAGSLPDNTWGYGKLDVLAAVTRVMASGDTEAPDIAIGLLRNSVLSDYLDLILLPSEFLAGVPDVDVSGTAVTVEAVLYGGTTQYAGDYRLTAPGAYTVTVQAADPAGNDTTITRDFAAALFSATASGALVSADGGLRLEVPAGGVDGPGYRLVRISDPILPIRTEEGAVRLARRVRDVFEDDRARSPVWTLSPESEHLVRPARLTVHWRTEDLAGTDPERLVLARRQGDAWVPLASRVDPRTRTVEAHIDRLGHFRLQEADAGIVTTWTTGLEPNWPNPFNGSTTIRFTLAESAPVEVVVLNVRGQRVRSLAAGTFGAGPHTVGWDGRGEDGRPLASGVYLVLLRTGGRVYTRKALLLQ
jgi:subtilisin family serine protease